MPYKLAFVEFDTDPQKLFDTLTDTIFFIDILLSFFSAYYNNETLVKDKKVIITPMNLNLIINILENSNFIHKILVYYRFMLVHSIIFF